MLFLSVLLYQSRSIFQWFLQGIHDFINNCFLRNKFSYWLFYLFLSTACDIMPIIYDNIGRKIMTHYQIWHAIELLARARKLSCSGLAKISGLDPTSFNKSKRFSKYKQPRWPSTYSIAKVLGATGATFGDFCKLVAESPESPTGK